MRYDIIFQNQLGTNMPTSRNIAWVTWLIASFFYAYQYILRIMPSIMMSDITHQFNIDAAIFGQFSGVYYIGYSLMHLPIGIMLDRFGPKKVMAGCILLTAIGLLPLILSHHWIYPVIGRAMIGIGSSAAILGTFKIIRMTFQEKYFSRMLSFSVTLGLIGAIYGGGPVSLMKNIWGYQTVIEFFIVIGLLLATIIYLVVPDEKPTHQTSITSNIKTVFTNWKVILICFSAGLMVGPLEGFSDVWGPEFLKQVYGFHSNIANSLPSIIFIGMCVGSPILSMIAEKTEYYFGVIMAAGITMFIIFAAMLSGGFNLQGLSISFFVVGISCAYQILAIYKASTYVPENLAGLTTAVANMIIMSFGYAFHSLIGFVIHSCGDMGPSKAYLYGISIIPGALIIGVFGMIILAINRTKLAATTPEQPFDLKTQIAEIQ